MNTFRGGNQNKSQMDNSLSALHAFPSPIKNGRGSQINISAEDEVSKNSELASDTLMESLK